MSQMNKVYIITTRNINSNEGGFINDNNFKFAEWDELSPLFDFYVDESVIASWVYSIYIDKEATYSQKLKDEIHELFIITFDPLDDLEGFMEDLTEKIIERKELLLHKYRKDLYSFVREQLTQTIEGVKQTSYYTIKYDNKRIIALPHLAESTNKNYADNKKWINALINCFADDDDEILLVLHDKDLCGCSGIPFQLLSPDIVAKLCERNNVRILVFEHGSKKSKFLCRENPDEAISELDKIVQEEIKEQELSEMCKNFRNGQV